MGEPILSEAVVGDGHRVEMIAPQLPVGTRVKITMEPVTATTAKRPVTEMIGCAKGLYANPQAVVDTIRHERDAWENGHGE